MMKFMVAVALVASALATQPASSRTLFQTYNPPGRGDTEKTINHATRDAAEAVTGQDCHWEAIPNEQPGTGRWRRKQLVCE